MLLPTVHAGLVLITGRSIAPHACAYGSRKLPTALKKAYCPPVGWPAPMERELHLLLLLATEKILQEAPAKAGFAASGVTFVAGASHLLPCGHAASPRVPPRWPALLAGTSSRNRVGEEQGDRCFTMHVREDTGVGRTPGR